MAENRKARAQSVNELTLDGERLVGSGRAMGTGYARGVTPRGTVGGGPSEPVGEGLRWRRPPAPGPPAARSARAARTARAGRSGGRPRWRERTSEGPASSPDATSTRAPDLGQPRERRVGRSAPVDERLVARPAGQAHGPLGGARGVVGHEAVADVGLEGVGPEAVERRLAGVVGQCLRPRRERGPASGGAVGQGVRRGRAVGRRLGRAQGPGGGAIGSNSHRPANVPGRACSARSRAPPPIEWPTPSSSPGGRSRPSITARTSSRKPSHGGTSPSGTTDAPWARKSIDQRSKPGPSAFAYGSHTRPWNPVAWQSRTGRRPSPRWWTASVAPVGTRHVAHQADVSPWAGRGCARR